MNEGSSFSNLAHFYTILDTFIPSQTLLLQFLILYDPEHSYTIISKVFLSIYNGVHVLL